MSGWIRIGRLGRAWDAFFDRRVLFGLGSGYLEVGSTGHTLAYGNRTGRQALGTA